MQALAQYPSSVWDGLSGHKDRSCVHCDLAPDSKDWDQVVAEVQATQTKLNTEAGYIDTLQSSMATAESDIDTLQAATQPAGTTGGLKRYVAEATGTATAATTFDIAVAVPAGARVVGAQLRVDTALASSDGGTAWSAAFITGSTTAIAAAQAFTKNTKANLLLSEVTTDATNIRVTADSAKTFEAGGVVRAIVYYEKVTAMADAA